MFRERKWVFKTPNRNGFLGAKLSKVHEYRTVRWKQSEFFAPKSFWYFFDKKYGATMNQKIKYKRKGF